MNVDTLAGGMHCPRYPIQTNQKATMSKITTLHELYVDELKDLWSANDQMAKALKKIMPKAQNPKLVAHLESAHAGVIEHIDMLKSLIDQHNGTMKKEHCKGMEGLVLEAVKHTIDDAPKAGPVLDASIIAQYQRMTHYGITGFGTVSSFAKALKLDADRDQLQASVGKMYSSDELMSELAESAVNVDAAAA
jgi:ferritin-like metal-binding protein YciE